MDVQSRSQNFTIDFFGCKLICNLPLYDRKIGRKWPLRLISGFLRPKNQSQPINFLVVISHNLLTNVKGPMHNVSAPLSVLDLHSNQVQGKLAIFPVHDTCLDHSINNFNSIIPLDIGTNLLKNNLSGSLFNPCAIVQIS